MTQEQEKLMNEYKRELLLSGRKTARAMHDLRVFFGYSEEAGKDYLRMSVRDAQEFQMQLTMRTRPDGAMRYSNASVRNIIGSVRVFHDYLKRNKLISSNPFEAIDRLRKLKSLPKNILNEEKMDLFLRHLREFWKASSLNRRKALYRLHVASELMYSTGARVNEAARIKPSDIDFERGTVRIKDGKAKRERVCILNEYAGKVLKLYVDHIREYVFRGPDTAGRELLFGAVDLHQWMNLNLNRESCSLGLGRFTSHCFRHAVGYHLLRGGCGIRHIQEILGHNDLGTTQIYTKVDKEDLKGVIDEFHPRRIKGLPQRHEPLQDRDTEED